MNAFILSQNQGAKLEEAVTRTKGTATHIEWLCKGDNFNSVILLANGDAALTLKEKPVKELPIYPA